ncbi:MAG: hypothetical protein R3C09_28215, partial [Pirellulaceae bacterium]
MRELANELGVAPLVAIAAGFRGSGDGFCESLERCSRPSRSCALVRLDLFEPERCDAAWPLRGLELRALFWLRAWERELPWFVDCPDAWPGEPR